MKKIFNLVLFFLLLVMVLNSVNANESFPVDARTNCIQISDTSKQCTQGSQALNALDEDGEWKACSEILSYEVGDNFIEFNFGANGTRLEWDYDVKYVGFVNFMKRLFDNIENDAVFDVEQRGCSFYFLQNFENDEFVLDELKYKMPKNFKFKNNILTDTASGLSIDFNQAVDEQNVEIEEAGKELVFTGENISRLDPTVTFYNPTVVTQDDTYSACSSWTFLHGALNEDGAFAVCETDNGLTDTLITKTYGFDIPAGATVDGVSAGIKRSCSSGNDCNDISVKLVVQNSIVGDNKSLGTVYGTGSVWKYFGGASDTWGATLNATAVNAADFGLSYIGESTHVSPSDAEIDAMVINITYTATASAFPLINFTNPTVPNATQGVNKSFIVNISVTEADLDSIVWNWNGTNYSMFDDSLVLMMNFDNRSGVGESYTNSNGSIVVDLSHFKNNGSVQSGDAGDISYTTGKYGGAYNFDGVDDAINFSANSFPDLSEYTLSAWIKTNASAGRIIERRAFFSDADAWRSANFLFYTTGGKLAMAHVEAVGQAVPVVTSVTSAADNSWHHVFGVYDGSEMKIYLDGALENTTSATYPNMSGIQFLAIGKTSYDNSAYFNGLIDEVRIWNRDLSEAEIYEQYASNLVKFNSTYWEFYINQSKNLTAGLIVANYTYEAYATDISNNFNSTGVRVYDKLQSSNIALDIIYPTEDINATKNSFFNVTINASCSVQDCGETNISLMWKNLTVADFYNIFQLEASGNCTNEAAAYDGNWSTSASISDTAVCTTLINYTVPFSAVSAIVESKSDTAGTQELSCWNYTSLDWSSTWDIDVGSIRENNTIHSECYPYGEKLRFNVFLDDSGAGDPDFQELQVWWNVTSGYETLLLSSSGVPFYTNTTNSNTTTLDSGDSFLKTFWVNASGILDSNVSFFAIANVTNDMTISNITNHFNVTVRNANMNLDLIYPLTNINVTQNAFFNVTINTSCSESDCGEINISLAYINGSDEYFYNATDNGEASGDCGNIANAYDGDWSTSADEESGGSCNIYINYTAPIAVGDARVESRSDDEGDQTLSCWNHTSSAWLLLADISASGYRNDTLPAECYSDKLQLKIYLEDTGGPGPDFYEEQVWWNITSTLSTLVVPISGTPFYTNASNPNTTTLSVGGNLLKTFFVNASGAVGINNSFFVFVNKTADMTISNITSQVNVTIVSASSDSCVYGGSGNWAIDCSENCNVDASTNLANDIIFSGTGSVNINSQIRFTSTGQKAVIGSGCKLVINSGGGFS